MLLARRQQQQGKNLSPVASAERTLMSNSDKHELLFINLVTVPAGRNSNSTPA